MDRRPGRRRLVHGIVAIGAAAAFGRAGSALAQQPRRLGVFHWENRKSFDEARPGIFRALAERGWREGDTLLVDWHGINVRSPLLERKAAELAATLPDAILTESTPATRALLKATTTIPIVTSVADPVRSGFAASLARPGRNVTGLCNQFAGWEAKCLEMLRAFAPRLGGVMLFYPGPASSEFARPFIDAAAKMGLDPRLSLVASIAETESALRQGIAAGARAAVVGPLELVAVRTRGQDDESMTKWLAEALPRNRIAAIAASGVIDDRFLLSTEPYHANMGRSFAGVLDKVLRGTKPADIAFEQPDAAHIVLNRKIARATGLDVPSEILLRATRVIE